jgi:putative oxidoreductase
MNAFISCLLKPTSQTNTERALCFLRISLGILTLFHGIPKIMGGFSEWAQLGTFVQPLGIYFWPTFWGLLGACTEFFGGISLILGLGTRIAAFALTIMMFVATSWHLHRGDIFNVYSFPLTLIFVYYSFVIIGGGMYSLDSYLLRNQK